MNPIIISNKTDFEKKKKEFIRDGSATIHVLSDFDKTLTKGLVQGKKANTLISYIRDGNYLTSDYPAKAHALFDVYNPIEIDVTVPLEEKKEKMLEWWTLHTDLLVRSEMNQSVIEDIVQKNDIHFRAGSLEFLEYIHTHHIPVIIMSAGPGQLIEEFLKKEKRMYDNMHVIANFFIWDAQGNAIGRREPIIHTFNKHEIEMKGMPFYESLVTKKNVILLGDMLGDVGMVEGFAYNNLLKIGFLNEKVEENLEAYKKQFDVVITHDGDFSFVNNFMKEIVNN